MTIEYICSTVSALLEKYDQRDVWRLAKDMGVLVRREPMGAGLNDCKGFFICQSRKRLITVSSDLDGDTQRIIMAHELGHACLHLDAARLSAFHDFALYDAASQYEYEANLFAAELLLEDSEVMEKLREDDFFFSAAKKLSVPPELLDFKFRILKHKGICLNSPILSRSDFLKGI